jgi:methylenetetrahydrofolate dehydrogenase (NADP+)/methenyltetrahydrofolate cyclohydrolase
METKVINCEKTQSRIFNDVKGEAAFLSLKFNKKPGICFLGFKNVPLSKYNFPYHVQMAKAAGFHVMTELLEEHVSEADLIQMIDSLNFSPDIHAIVLFQPVPPHLSPVWIVNRIRPDKEVEGFHPQNMLNTLMPDLKSRRFPMCLPAALQEIASDADIVFHKDQEWVFVMDDEFISNNLTNMIIKSAASQAVPQDCPVTYINRESKKLAEVCKRADVLVIVSKVPEYLEPQCLKPGVFIIDIYSNLVREVPSKEDPCKLIPVIRGGVNVASVMNIASAVLPIPGGLMTVVLPILLRNTLIAFKNQMKGL